MSIFLPPKIPLFSPVWNFSLFKLFFQHKENPKQDIINLLNKKISQKNWLLCSSGSASLYFILKSFGATIQDEIIVPTYLCANVFNVILDLRLKLIFSDIDLDDLNISLDSIEDKVSPNTKFIIVPSLYGNPANIIQIKKKFPKLIVIDDAAQAFGCTINNEKIGTIGDAGFFSIGMGKPLFGPSGSFFWTSGINNSPKPKRVSWLFNLSFWAYFLFARLWIQKTKYFPLNLLSLFISYFYFFCLKFFYHYDDQVFNLNFRVAKTLIEKFPLNQSQLRSYHRKLREIVNKTQVGRVLMPKRGIGIVFKLVIICTDRKKRAQLTAVLEENRIFYSLGYQYGSKFFDPDNYPNTKNILSKIIEIPIPKNDWQLELLMTTISSINN